MISANNSLDLVKKLLCVVLLTKGNYEEYAPKFKPR